MLVIEAITVRGQPVADPVRATFDQGGGTIGRGSTSTLVLADPDRHISRVQATIEFQAGDYVITDTGTLNPLTVNGRPLGGGAHALLKDGDELSVGPYRLRVHVSGMVPSASAPAPRVPQVQSSGAIKDDPLEMFSGPSSSGPFDDLLPADLKLPVPQSGAGAHAQGFAPSQAQVPSAKVGGNAIPDDFNPFGEEAARSDPFGSPEKAPAESPAPVDDIGDFYELRDARVEPCLRNDWIIDGPAPGAPKEPDPMGLHRFAPNDQHTSVPDHLPAIHEHYKPPPPLRDPRPAEPDTTLNGKVQAAASESAQLPANAVELQMQLAEAFLRGAGVKDVKFPNGMTPQLMEIIGCILRESVQGTLDLLLARTQVKTEIHASATIIVPRDNNPLKFSPNAEVALSHLLEPKGKGFMTPIRAMRDAYDDLRAHQIAVLAGMRAALAGVMLRFRPERLETKLNDKSMLDSLLPMNRKAKQWDLFAELYREISAEAEEDYRVVFGKEFRRAYEAQLAKFRASDSNAARR